MLQFGQMGLKMAAKLLKRKIHHPTKTKQKMEGFCAPTLAELI